MIFKDFSYYDLIRGLFLKRPYVIFHYELTTTNLSLTFIWVINTFDRRRFS